MTHDDFHEVCDTTESAPLGGTDDDLGSFGSEPLDGGASLLDGGAGRFDSPNDPFADVGFREWASSWEGSGSGSDGRGVLNGSTEPGTPHHGHWHWWSRHDQTEADNAPASTSPTSTSGGLHTLASGTSLVGTAAGAYQHGHQIYNQLKKDKQSNPDEPNVRSTAETENDDSARGNTWSDAATSDTENETIGSVGDATYAVSGAGNVVGEGVDPMVADGAEAGVGEGAAVADGAEVAAEAAEGTEVAAGAAGGADLLGDLAIAGLALL
jgi:hypothetical protein